MGHNKNVCYTDLKKECYLKRSSNLSLVWEQHSALPRSRSRPGLLRHSQQTHSLTGAAVRAWGRGLQGTAPGLPCPAGAALEVAAAEPGPCPAGPCTPSTQLRPFPGPHLLDALHQSVLVEGHGLCTLVQVLLVPQAQLQHLLRVQLLQLGVGRRRLPAQESYKAKERPRVNPAVHTSSAAQVQETAEQTQQTGLMRGDEKLIQSHLRMFWIYSSV